jgi:hypothetical protein
MYARCLEVSDMESHYAVGQKVAVNIGGCAENRTEGVIIAIRSRPALDTYEVHFPGYRKDPRIDTFYMAADLIPLDEYSLRS